MIATVRIFDGERYAYLTVTDNPWYDPSLPDDYWDSTWWAFHALGHVGEGDWRERGPSEYRVLHLREKCSQGKHVVLDLSEWQWRKDASGRGWHHTPGKLIKSGEVHWLVAKIE